MNRRLTSQLNCFCEQLLSKFSGFSNSQNLILIPHQMIINYRYKVITLISLLPHEKKREKNDLQRHCCQIANFYDSMYICKKKVRKFSLRCSRVCFVNVSKMLLAIVMRFHRDHKLWKCQLYWETLTSLLWMNVEENKIYSKKIQFTGGFFFFFILYSDGIIERRNWIKFISRIFVNRI